MASTGSEEAQHLQSFLASVEKAVVHLGTAQEASILLAEAQDVLKVIYLYLYFRMSVAACMHSIHSRVLQVACMLVCRPD